MNIAVLVKQVPDTDEVRLDPETGTMIREGLGTVINPLDLHAIELALQIKRTLIASVTALTMGPPAADEAMREAVALGVDRAVLLTDRRFSGADTWATSNTLSEALKILGPFDLIVAGEKATDGETGQVGPETAAMLGIPAFTYITSIISTTESGMIIERSSELGREKWSISYPVLLTVTKNVNDPQLPTLSGKKRAHRFGVERLGADDLDLSDDQIGLKGSPTRVVRIHTPKVLRKTTIYESEDLNEGVHRVVELLKELKR